MEHESQRNKVKQGISKRRKFGQHFKRTGLNAIDFASQPLPKSLEWVYGFGFKVGVFLILKSFLAMRFLHLSFSGILIVCSQLIMAAAFIVFGLVMQRPGSLFDFQSLRLTSIGYGGVGLYSTVICFAKANFDMNFFQKAAAKNWFVDFFNGVFKGIGEFSMSIVFWDIDLWTMFCFILLILTVVSARISYPDGKLLRKERSDETSLVA